jgi:CAAX protease family protein
VTLASIPWDFLLILVFLGTIVPWRGAVRVSRLLTEELPPGARLSLYISTISFQWLIVAFVAWRAFSRGLEIVELGLIVADPLRTTWITVALTGLLCANQVASLRMMARVPKAKRGSLYRLTEKIMPRTSPEAAVFAVLACTAGASEEFLYRGFVLAVFMRMFASSAQVIVIAGILSSAWFAVGHLYQGRRGIITTFIVGIIFAGIRVWSGSLMPSMVAHAGIDLIAGLYQPKAPGKAE